MASQLRDTSMFTKLNTHDHESADGGTHHTSACREPAPRAAGAPEPEASVFSCRPVAGSQHLSVAVATRQHLSWGIDRGMPIGEDGAALLVGIILRGASEPDAAPHDLTMEPAE